MRFTRIFGLICLSVLLCGCEYSQVKCTSLEPKQTTLAAKLVCADRIVITNLDAPIIRQFQGFSLILSGRETYQIVGDISQMYAFSATTPPTLPTNSSFDWELRFYRRTNFLVSIRMGSSTFEYDNDEFGGDNGALEALSDRLSNLITPSEER
jgi:hypothetical protein